MALAIRFEQLMRNGVVTNQATRSALSMSPHHAATWLAGRSQVLMAWMAAADRIRNISKSTVRNVLKEHDFDPGPNRGKGTWDVFIRIHTQTSSASDFFSRKVWTLGELFEYFVLFFVQPGTRKVHIAGMTANPDAAWMAKQARNALRAFESAQGVVLEQGKVGLSEDPIEHDHQDEQHGGQ